MLRKSYINLVELVHTWQPENRSTGLFMSLNLNKDLIFNAVHGLG